MKHGLNHTFLYTACKIVSTFENVYAGSVQTITGTCFFTVNKYRQICLITNRHVVDYSFRKDCAGRKYELIGVAVENHSLNQQSQLPDTITLITVKNFKQIEYSKDSENDIACLIGIEATDTIDIAFSIPYDWIAGKSFIDTSLQVCDFVAFPGFPDWYDKLNNNPILRTGTIASDPRFNYSNESTYAGERIAYEAFSFGGSSGSPVFSLQQGFQVSGIFQMTENFYRPPKLIGINGGHLTLDEKQHSGISYFYKSTAILAIIDAEKSM